MTPVPAVDLTLLIGSGMPVVLAGFFAFVVLLRRRDRRRTSAEEEDL